PPFDFQAPEGPIYTRRRFLPAARVLGASVERAMISDGCFVQAGANLTRCILGVRSQGGEGATGRGSGVIGADEFESDAERRRNRERNGPDLGIGDGSTVEKAILDKDCRVGKNVQIVNRRGLQEHDDALYSIRDGIVVIPKGVTVPDGMVI